MIYLASPYSHPEPLVRDQRFLAACRATVRQLLAGHSVFSPIVRGHPLVGLGLPADWNFWARHDEQHLSRCDQLLVLPVEGWQASEGVRAEIELAKRLGLPVLYAQEGDVAPVSPTARHHAQLGQRAPERDVGERGAIGKEDHL